MNIRQKKGRLKPAIGESVINKTCASSEMYSIIILVAVKVLVAAIY